MTFKPVDTAIIMVVGPIINDSDFKSLEEAIAYNAAGMDVSLIVEKTDGTTSVTVITLTTGGTSDWTHADGGYYEIEVTAAQNAEEGIAYIRGICTGVLPFESPRYSIVKANVYDSLIKGTDILQTDVTQLAGVAQSLTDLKDLVDTGYDSVNHKIQSDLIYIHGSALTETAGQLAAAFTKLFDVATPLLVASDVMRGTEGAALAATALTDVTWTDAKAAFLDHSIATVDTVVDGIQTDLDNATDGLGALKALIDTVDGIVDAILLDTGTDGVVVATASKTGYALIATGADLILKDSTFALAIADAMCDEALTGAEHNIPTSLGRRIREIGAYAIHSGTAQAGDSVHITLAATASATDGLYNRNLLVLIDGTGAQQTRTIIDYDGATKIATIDREWRVNPDVTTEYQIVADDTPLVVDQGVAQNGTSTTIKLREYASSIDDTYLCNIVIILAGTGRGQARLVNAYNGTTKVVTICGDNWVTTPDDTSVYVMIPYGATCVACVGTDALAQINTECDTALSDYDGPTRTEATTDKNAIITEVDANETKIDTVDANISAILEDTSITLETHLTDIKGTGFTKDIDSLPQCLTAVGFSTHDVDAIQTALEADNGKLYAVYAALLNKMTVTSTLMRIYKDDAITLLNELTLSDDDTTVTRV